MPSRKTGEQRSKWRPAPETLVRTFDSLMDTVPDAERRKMFGYPCAFVNGNMFAGLHQENLILRLSEPDREALRGEGGRPFEPMAGRVMREYVAVPDSILADHQRLTAWTRKSFKFAERLPPKPAKSPRKR